MLWALPFIQATEVILHKYSKFPVFERGLWKRPIGEQLRRVSVLPRPLPKQQVRQYCYINSDPENIEQEDCAEPLHARILQDILKW